MPSSIVPWRVISKRKAVLVSLAGAMLALGSSVATAEADGPDFYKVTGIPKGDILNIRVSPDAHAAKVGEIPPEGTCIRNRGCQGGLTFQEYSTLSKSGQVKRLKQNPRWCQVEYQGVTGWVAGRYLAEGGCP